MNQKIVAPTQVSSYANSGCGRFAIGTANALNLFTNNLSGCFPRPAPIPHNPIPLTHLQGQQPPPAAGLFSFPLRDEVGFVNLTAPRGSPSQPNLTTRARFVSVQPAGPARRLSADNPTVSFFCSQVGLLQLQLSRLTLAVFGLLFEKKSFQFSASKDHSDCPSVDESRTESRPVPWDRIARRKPQVRMRKMVPSPPRILGRR